MLEYTPYGEVSRNTGPYTTDKRFTGKTWDETSALMYYGARYYDPQIGRFVTADPTIQRPYDPQDFNRYTYTRSNPIKYVDPTGLGWWDWLWSFIAGVVGAIITVVCSAIPVIGTVLGAAIGGAVSGAILGAVHGGLEGALKGAAMGFVIGGILGAGYQAAAAAKLGGAFVAGAAIGGAAYAGATGGAEGLANYAAGALGAMYGSAIGSTLLPKSTVQASNSSKTPTQKGQPKSTTDIQAEESLSSSNLVAADDTAASNPSKAPAQARAEGAAKSSQSAQEGNTGRGNNTSVESKSSAKNLIARALEVRKEVHQLMYNAGKNIGQNKIGRAYGAMAGMEMVMLGGTLMKAGGVAIATGGPGGWAGGTFFVGLGAEVTWLGVDFLRGVAAGAAP